MVSAESCCALCGLHAAGSPVRRVVAGETKIFCCEGCATVYEVAGNSGLLAQLLSKPERKRSGLSDLLPSRHSAFFQLDGMWCSGCAIVAQRILEHQPGVSAAEVSYTAERGRLWYDPARTTPEVALRDLQKLGYRVHLLTDAEEERIGRHQERVLLQLIAAASFGMWVMLLYIAFLYHYYAAGQLDTPEVRQMQYLVLILTTPILLFGGISFPLGAVRAARARTATMDTLVTLGVFSAYVYSVYVTFTGAGEAYFDSVAMIVTFVMLGRYLETLGGGAARKDVRKLLSLQPKNAWRRDGDTWLHVPASQLAAGDTILIKPGERIPADAEILEGYGAVDESLLTGESTPVNKGPGETAYAGSLLTDVALIGRVAKAPQDTRLAHIAGLVERTLASKPPIQRLADKASAWLTFAILITSGLTAAGWWATGHPLSQATLTAVAVLVIACPCALGLATPLAVVTSLGLAAQRGVLLRNAVAMETAARIRRVVFDKTGTLTSGKMSVKSVVVNPELPLSQSDLLGAAAAVEQFSEHPVARAIWAAADSGPIPNSRGFQTTRGLGAGAFVEAIGQVRVGSMHFLNVKADSPLAAEASARAERGETVIWVGWNDAVAGFLTLWDEPSTSAPGALRWLEAKGIRTVVLSGDNPLTTQALASELGLAESEGNCSPLEKVARIQAWQETGESVAMAGDGVNDAPAMALADLSITVAGGTDIAGEASDVLLTHADLALIPQFIEMSRRTRRIIYLNLVWAFAYNLLAVPLAALGLISPIIAAAAMAASSLLVVVNSLRLRR